MAHHSLLWYSSSLLCFRCPLLDLSSVRVLFMFVWANSSWFSSFLPCTGSLLLPPPFSGTGWWRMGSHHCQRKISFIPRCTCEGCRRSIFSPSPIDAHCHCSSCVSIDITAKQSVKVIDPLLPKGKERLTKYMAMLACLSYARYFGTAPWNTKTRSCFSHLIYQTTSFPYYWTSLLLLKRCQ